MKDVNSRADVSRNESVLHDDLSLASAARRIMRRHVEQMTPAEWTATEIDGWPSNRLKEMRITVRKLRMDLRLFAPYFKKRTVRGLRAGAGDFAAVLGAPREFDMLIDLARGYTKTQDDGQRGMASLIEEWKDLRRVARSALADHLGAESHRRWVGSMTQFVDESIDHRDPAPEVGAPSVVRHVVRVGLWQYLAAVQAFDVLPDAPSPEHLHELRIAVKRLRYFVDAWQDVVDAAPRATVLAACAEIQRALGAINDAHTAGMHAVQFVARQRDLRRSDVRSIVQFAETQQQFVEAQIPAWRALLAPLFSFHSSYP
jgi:CHAD domain-containing protein